MFIKTREGIGGAISLRSFERGLTVCMLGSIRRLQRTKGVQYGVTGKIGSKNAFHKRMEIEGGR